MKTTRPWKSRSVKIGPKRSYASSSSGSGSSVKRRVRAMLKFVSPGGKGTVAAQDQNSFTYHLLGQRKLWHLCGGQRPALEVRVRLEPDTKDIQMFQCAIRVAPLNVASQKLALEQET